VSPSPARFRSTLAAVVDQPEDLRELRRFHKVLADVNRLRIVRRLADGPATVTELIEHVGLSQPLVSWHLGKLREVGLVAARRNGREVVHTIVPEAFAAFALRESRVLGLEPSAAPAVDLKGAVS
jgi:DNA-binding transcriptional ArsR family regulator